jgi:hypothetical protein
VKRICKESRMMALLFEKPGKEREPAFLLSRFILYILVENRERSFKFGWVRIGLLFSHDACVCFKLKTPWRSHVLFFFYLLSRFCPFLSNFEYGSYVILISYHILFIYNFSNFNYLAN